MKVEDLEKSVIRVFEVWEKIGINPTHVTLEYVGGEVTMLPMETLRKMVLVVRALFKEKQVEVRDGVQSNLLCSKRKLDDLLELFDGRVGTSIDNWSDQRRFNGSSHKYRTFFLKSESHIQENHNVILPAVITVDKHNIDHLVYELELANKIERSLVFRAIFEGGSAGVEMLSSESISKAYVELFDEWVQKKDIIVDPFYTLLKRRMRHRRGLLDEVNSYCSWKSNCAKQSLSLEPNGDLYVCQELADAKTFKLGNAIAGDIDYGLIEKLFQRESAINDECGSCDYLNDCRGGCMVHSINAGLDYLAKTPYCGAWKSIFSHIDNALNQDERAIKRWLHALERKNGIK
ncbi:SPASM domain-containing protein [Vibrio owensii]|uniref:SPASM domain-containing protein n=1 Tax=Vibrio owensii TaxID=696485 RepID=UPI003CC58D70